MNLDLSTLRERFLRQQQASLDELSKLPDVRQALRELIKQLHREAPRVLNRLEGSDRFLASCHWNRRPARGAG